MKDNSARKVMQVVLFVICLVLTLIGLVYLLNTSKTATTKTTGELGHWTDSARAKQELVSFMEAITDENSADYIPVERRIAVFDLDGTLFSETNPIYFDHSLLLHRVLEDPDYTPSEKELDCAAKILQWVQDGHYPEGMDTEHGQAIASSFAGMTVEEFENYVAEYGKEQAPGYDGMTRAESLYVPMMEVLDYLADNGFTSYVVSGTDRLIVRGGLSDTLGLPANQIIGSDEAIVAYGQGDNDGLSYQFTHDDKLILSGQFITKNLKMNKVAVIAQEIGVQPVLSFGNSTGDSSMANYVITDNPYRSLAFMLCCDDLDREYGNIEKADKMKSLCEEEGWIPISMKDDWTTIYGDGVIKNPSFGLDVYDREYEDIKDRLEALDDAA